MKMRREHIVPLSSQVIKILEDLKCLTGEFKYLFPAAGNFNVPMNADTVRVALRTMGFSKSVITPHVFNPDVIERQLSHTEINQVRVAYNRAEYLPERIKIMQLSYNNNIAFYSRLKHAILQAEDLWSGVILFNLYLDTSLSALILKA